MWGPRSASSPLFPLPLYLFPTVTQWLALRKRPARPAPSSPATPQCRRVARGANAEGSQLPAPVPGNLSATLQIPVPSLISQNPPPPPWGFLPVRRKKRGGEGEKEKLEGRELEAARRRIRGRRPAGPPRRRLPCRRGRLRRGCRAWTANEPEQLRPGTASRRTPALLLRAATPPTRRRL
jgi:hypothetical protein